MNAKTCTLKACDFLLFGAKGDLTCRKLLPALYHLQKRNLLSDDTRIIMIARDKFTLSDYGDFAQEQLRLFLKENLDCTWFDALFKKMHYLQMDLADLTHYEALKPLVQPELKNTISYFATPPTLFGTICKGLAQIGLTSPSARVVLEKPIGHDLSSSIRINDEVAQFYTEAQIYRIDHYLGKETVLNLIALRFANTLFASNWDRTMIDSIQITVAEEVGVEGRWGYYDGAGQLKDMVQNHLLQLLSLIAMEPPASLDADSIRDEKLKVLKALRPINIGNVREKTVRGQYTSGFVGRQSVPGYLEEVGAHATSKTETFVALKVDIDTWRWAGVPFYLRTGKRLPKKISEIAICFRPQVHNIFHRLYPQLSPNKLTIRLQPDEGIDVQIMNKTPGLGDTMRLQQTKLDLSFDKTFHEARIADAYERLLLEVMLGHQYLFVRRDEVECAWKWIDGIVEALGNYNEAPLPYQAGTWGPMASVSLLARDDRQWEE